MRVRPTVVALLLCLLCLPAFAAPKCSDPIQSFSASDAQTGEAVAMTWSLGGIVPLSQTIAGHDFAEPVTLPPNQLSYSYVPKLPGEKHVTLTVVTECGTFSLTRKYHVKQCNVVTPFLTVDKTTVAPGETINASIELEPGHTARWVVTNGAPSATSGAAIQIVAGASGSVGIEVFVSRGSSCEVSTGAAVAIVQPCSIAEPVLQSSPAQPVPNTTFRLTLMNPNPNETATFTASGAIVLQTTPAFIVVLAPASGSFTINVALTNGACSKTFSRSYTITPCNAAAVVSKVSGSCGTGIVAADFTGTAPFQGRWSDGVTFVTNDPHIERSVTRAGTYRITFFRDANCVGTSSGSATVSAAPPVPFIDVDPIAEGGYYGYDTCPGLVRGAQVLTPVPAGYEVVWSIQNGTILSGQGTPAVQFSGAAPGPSPLTAVLRNITDGCTSQPGSIPYITTLGTPEISVSVEPATIGPGGTAVVSVTRLNPYGRSSGVYSSLPFDTLQFLDDDGTVTRYEYRSSSGPGVATITAESSNACSQPATVTATLTIDASIPVIARANVRLIGSSCRDNAVFAEFTGTPPFSGRWSTGESFFGWDSYAFLYPTAPGTYTLTEFSDANGAGSINGSATYDYAPLPRPQISSQSPACPNSVVTATIANPIPGAAITWMTWNATILSGQGTDSVQVQLDGVDANVTAYFTTPESCSPDGFWFFDVIDSVQQPNFQLYGVYSGSSTEIYVSLDPNTETWAFENSLGDAMEIVSQITPTFYLVRYTSSHGPGDSTVRIYGTTTCGAPFEATAVMTVFPVPPTATLTSTPGAMCGATVTATLRGVAPFTGAWSDTGETFTTSDTTVTHFVRNTRYLRLRLTDATGLTSFSNEIYVETPVLPLLSINTTYLLCPGATTTVTAEGAPAGAEILWSLQGTSGRIVSGQGTSALVVEATEPGGIALSAFYRTADGCESNVTGSSGIFVPGPAANPAIALASDTITAGDGTDVTITFDASSYESLSWETSNGDPLYPVDSNGQTFMLRYVSENGPGTSTIRAYGTTLCGQSVESTATITIAPANP
ncbi:MAG TPA: hypothetical protein VKB93_06765 [Thermoanaerobaculia bacterium]|nr:hypothetical protein [Thermoanaerobaculia bacterium]